MLINLGEHCFSLSDGKKKVKMPESTTSIDYVMEKASGPHFSGLRLSPSSTATTSSPRASVSTPFSATFADSDLPKQPFVIGNFSKP